uniref:Uncharacterized protein n=1 Tax=Rhizophora mucronata TaxID=61149 RepID=A0A2P2QBD9_RHIMU
MLLARCRQLKGLRLVELYCS